MLVLAGDRALGRDSVTVNSAILFILREVTSMCVFLFVCLLKKPFKHRNNKFLLYTVFELFIDFSFRLTPVCFLCPQAKPFLGEKKEDLREIFKWLLLFILNWNERKFQTGGITI